jgi:release factor glutamine methyltransferase
MKIQELLELGKNELSVLEEGALEARLLLEYTLDCDHHYIILNGEERLEDDLIDRYITCIQERKANKPIQYIMGLHGFYNLVLKVTTDTLIPRQETEILVEFILENIQDTDKLLMDIGTGTGCIPIAICNEKPAINAVGVDISKEALEVATYNSSMYELEERITFINSNLFAGIDSSYYDTVDILVSNPPYIPTEVIRTLDAQVKDYEPLLALDGGDDGLDYYKLISKEAKRYLADQGLIVFEVGHDQGEAVIQILKAYGYTSPGMIQDLSGVYRVVYATMNKI